MSTQNECSSFQAHAWKKETCANCMKSKASHSSAAAKSITSPTKHGGNTVIKRSTSNRASDSSSVKKSSSGATRDNVTSPRRTYNYGGYRSTMKRDNDSTDSQLSVKSNSSDKSTKSNRSGTGPTSRTNKVKRGDSKDSVLSNDKSPGSEKNVEQALKTLTSAAKASPKCGRKASRTTMNYAAISSSSTNNSANTSPTESSSNVANGSVGNKQSNSSWLHSGSSTAKNTAASNKSSSSSSSMSSSSGRANIPLDKNLSSISSSRVNIPLDKNVGKLSSVVNPLQKAAVTTSSSNSMQNNTNYINKNSSNQSKENIAYNSSTNTRTDQNSIGSSNNTSITSASTTRNTSVPSGSSGNSVLKSRDIKLDLKTSLDNFNKNIGTTSGTSASSSAASHRVEKRQVLIDKGKYSTEKIIFDKSTVITTTSKDIIPKVKSSSKTDKRSSKEELANITSNKTKGKTASGSGKDNVKSASSQRSVQSIVGNKDQSKRKSTSEMVNIEKQFNNSGKKSSNIATKENSPSDKTVKRQSSENVSDDPEYKPGSKVTRKRSKTRPPGPPPCVPPTAASKSSPRRAMIDSYHSDMSESQSNESQLSQFGASVENNPVTAAKDSGNKKGGGGDDSFSDLYNDIMNTLSETKDITPDLLNKLKNEGTEKNKSQQSHYYHKYDTGKKTKSPEKAESLTLSSALGRDGSTSIIIETMNTSFHAGSNDGEVEDITAQTLAMPYNIVDVSKIVPRGKSPRLPSTPAPESRNSTLNRSTLNKKKGSSCSASSTGSNSPIIRDSGSARNSGIIINHGDSVSLDDKICLDSDVLAEDNDSLQGLHPRYWHTYEPIDISAEAEKQRNKSVGPKSKKRNISSDKSSSSMQAADNSDKDIDKEAFIRSTAARATAPVRGQKNGSNKNLCNTTNSDNDKNNTVNSGSLAHLDLQEPKNSSNKNSISKSAEDLLDDMTDSLGEPKKRRNSSKKKNSGNGFFRRLFGFGRKTSDDNDEEDIDENTDDNTTNDGQFSSIQENPEFFKPLKVDTNLSPDDDNDAFKTASPSPTKSPEGLGLVSEIENAIFERKITPKDLKLVIPKHSDTSQKNSSNSSKYQNNMDSKKKVPASPIEPYGTSKDFIFIRNEKDIIKTDKSAAIANTKPTPPPIPTTNPRALVGTKPVLSPKPAKTSGGGSSSDSPTHKLTRNARAVSISNSPEHVVESHNNKNYRSFSSASLVSPGANVESSRVSGSNSQTSLLSDGSSDCRSISSREEQGSSGDSRELGRDGRLRKPRPKSQSVSRKMLEAPPPPPPGLEKRRSAEVSPPVNGGPISPKSAASGPTSPKSASDGSGKGSPPKTSPTSPTKLLTNPLAKLAQKGKTKRHSVSEDTYDTAKKVPSSPKKLEISAPIELQSSTFNSSQTLPRPVKKPLATTPVKESQDDLAATGRRKMDSVAKHARNKTVTEGVKFDVSMLNNEGESDQCDRLAELLDRKTSSKFVNRALPPTPAETLTNGTSSSSPKTNGPISHQKTASGDYEWVNTEGMQLASKKSRKDRSLYEEEIEEDIYTDPIEHSDDMAINNRIGNAKKSPLKTQMSLPGRLTVGNSPALKAPPSAFTDYLLPNEGVNQKGGGGKPKIGAKPVIYGDEKGTLVKNEFSLGPKPKNIQPLGHQANGEKSAETYVSMIYQNTEMIIDKTRPPLDVGEGFRRMAFINVETLLHVANTIVTNYLQQDAKIADELKFSHFILKSTRPHVHQGCVAYYRARTYKLKPNECMLMISAKYINPDLLHHTCVHLLQPSLIFSDRILATYFPDIANSNRSPGTTSSSLSTAATSSKVYQLGGMVQTNMAVITYHSIETLESYIQEELLKKASNGETFQRSVCYLLYQILSAVLSSHDGTSLYVIKTVKVADVLVVTHPSATDEQYLVINPLSSSDIEVMEDEVLCSDIVTLLCLFLDITTDSIASHSKVTADNVDNSINHLKNLTAEALRKIPGKSKYMSGLRKLVEVLKGGTISSIVIARSILEYTLWGPTDKEIKSLLLAEEREQAFCIWLEVTRCKGANELALGQLVKNLELAHMFHFLCSVTGSAMLDVTKLLYKHK